MTHGHRLLSLVLAPLVAFVASGCAYSVAGTKLAPLIPPRPSFQPRVEDTVGDFSFTLEGGKMVTSNLIGRLMNQQIMNSWQERGYIREEKSVDGGAFSGSADYNITLSGTQYGESSIAMQIISTLTLTLIPYTVTQHYDLQYTAEDVKSGKKFSASVQEEDKTYVELFLLFTLPVSGRGHQQTMERVGDHFYDQLYRQGLFQNAEATTAPAASEE